MSGVGDKYLDLGEVHNEPASMIAPNLETEVIMYVAVLLERERLEREVEERVLGV